MVDEREPLLIEGLSHFPIQVDWGWWHWVVAEAEPTQGGNDLAWDLRIRLSAPYPILVAGIMKNPGGVGGHLRGRTHAPESEHRFMFRFLPGYSIRMVVPSTAEWRPKGASLDLRGLITDFKKSSDMMIRLDLGAHGWQTTSSQLDPDLDTRLGPRLRAKVLIPSQETILAGTLQPLVSISAGACLLSVLVIARTDALISHWRWRLPREVPLQDSLAWLPQSR